MHRNPMCYVGLAVLLFGILWEIARRQDFGHSMGWPFLHCSPAGWQVEPFLRLGPVENLSLVPILSSQISYIHKASAMSIPTSRIQISQSNAQKTQS